MKCKLKIIPILPGPILVKMLKVMYYLLDKHFAINHKYHKISYNYIDNIKNIIIRHNREIANFYSEINGKTSNCKDKSKIVNQTKNVKNC